MDHASTTPRHRHLATLGTALVCDVLDSLGHRTVVALIGPADIPQIVERRRGITEAKAVMALLWAEKLLRKEW